MPTHILGSRPRFFHDVDGILSVAKDIDSIESFTLDWQDELRDLSNDTISSATFEANGVTIDSSSNTTTTTTMTISKSGGYVDIDVVTAGGSTLTRRVRIYQSVR